MNEIQLSDSLPVIETEIRQYQNLAGESIFEIGRRLKHVKENDLAHGEFGKWLENVQLSKSQADRFIKVYKENESGKLPHVGNIAFRVLYEIATLPEPERTKEHVTSKGETKTPDEMTVKELRELKKQLKQRDEELEYRDSLIQSTQRENEILQSKVDEAENKEPEVKTVYKEKVPKYIEQQMKDKEQELLEARRAKEEAERRYKEAQEKMQSNNRTTNISEDEQIGSRRFQAENNVLDLKDNITQFLEENAVNAFREGAIAMSSERTKNNLMQGVEELEAFCRAMRSSMNNRITIN